MIPRGVIASIIGVAEVVIVAACSASATVAETAGAGVGVAAESLVRPRRLLS